MKQTATSDPMIVQVKLPTGVTITTGPGTVPISLGSVSQTSIEEMKKFSKQASALGVFDVKQEK